MELQTQMGCLCRRVVNRGHYRLAKRNLISVGRRYLAKRHNFDKVEIFNTSVLRRVAERHLSLMYQRVLNGRDYRDRQFPKYSSGYEKLLGNDFRKKDGTRYARYRGLPLTTGGNKIAKRPLLLRGLTMGNLRVRSVRKDSWVSGWDGEAGGIVEGQARKGRDVISGVPESEEQFIIRELGKALDKEIDKIPNIINL